MGNKHHVNLTFLVGILMLVVMGVALVATSVFAQNSNNSGNTSSSTNTNNSNIDQTYPAVNSTDNSSSTNNNMNTSGNSSTSNNLNNTNNNSSNSNSTNMVTPSVTSQNASLSSQNPPLIVNINANGRALIRGYVMQSGQSTSTSSTTGTTGNNSSSSVSVQTWGGVWNVRVMNPSQIVVPVGNLSSLNNGDFIGVIGTVATDTPFTIDATILRDWTTTNL